MILVDGHLSNQIPFLVHSLSFDYLSSFGDTYYNTHTLSVPSDIGGKRSHVEQLHGNFSAVMNQLFRFNSREDLFQYKRIESIDMVKSATQKPIYKTGSDSQSDSPVQY